LKNVPIRPGSRLIAIPLWAVLILTACTRDEISPATEPVTPNESAAAALAACDVSAQAAALQAADVPDWKALGIATCYELTFELNPAEAAYSGRARITHSNLSSEELPDLVFRLYPNADVIYGGTLIVDGIEVNDAAVEPEALLSDSTAIRLLLPTPLAPGADVVITMNFRGKPPIDFVDNEHIYGNFNYDLVDQIMTLANAFPMLAVRGETGWQVTEVLPIGDAVVSEVALFHVQLSAPPDWSVVSTGTTTAAEGGVHSIVTGPVRDFIVSASPNFERIEAVQSGVRIQHWGLADGEARWAETLQATADAIVVFTDRFGTYPYAELDVIAVPMSNAAGIEYPGVFLLNRKLYNPNPARPFLLGLVVAHETAHQWWYGVVGNDVLTAPWQDEALTTYSSLLYQADHQERYYAGTLDFYEQAASEAERSADNADLAQPVSAFIGAEDSYSGIVYQKGALFFTELRAEIGDDAFFAALREYYANNRFQLAAASDMLGAFESSCACPLDAFYHDWGVN